MTVLKILSPGKSFQQDSAAYKLCNMIGCFYSSDKERLYLSYLRGVELAEGEVSLQEMDAALPGLGQKIVEFQEIYPPVQRVKTIATYCAYLFDHVIDLREAGFTDTNFPLVTKLVNVRKHPSSDNYMLQGYGFRLDGMDANNLPQIKCCPSGAYLLTPEVIERLWPGGVQAIEVLNALGATDFEVVNALYELKVQVTSPVDVNLPSFE